MCSDLFRAGAPVEAIWTVGSGTAGRWWVLYSYDHYDDCSGRGSGPHSTTEDALPFKVALARVLGVVHEEPQQSQWWA